VAAEDETAAIRDEFDGAPFFRRGDRNTQAIRLE
jgi:hypothetical protein